MIWTVPRRALLLLLLTAPLLAGCESQASAPSAATSSASSAASPAGTSPPAGSPSASPSPTPPAPASPVVVLQGDGLGILAGDAVIRPLPFVGTPAAVVQQAVEAAFGPTDPLALPGCPQGPRTALSVDGFRLLTDGARFTGWTDEGSATRSLTTTDGIGAGSRLGDLQSAQPDVHVVPTADGARFTTTAGLSGVLDGTDPVSQILELSGGETCPVP